jgi:hypothetical protein
VRFQKSVRNVQCCGIYRNIPGYRGKGVKVETKQQVEGEREEAGGFGSANTATRKNFRSPSEMSTLPGGSSLPYARYDGKFFL